jgi:hypothetical protein
MKGGTNWNAGGDLGACAGVRDGAGILGVCVGAVLLQKLDFE